MRQSTHGLTWRKPGFAPGKRYISSIANKLYKAGFRQQLVYCRDVKAIIRRFIAIARFVESVGIGSTKASDACGGIETFIPIQHRINYLYRFQNRAIWTHPVGNLKLYRQTSRGKFPEILTICRKALKIQFPEESQARDGRPA
ncbi:MAG: hypothetical protein Q7T96_05720 [Methylobacter sp.]|nr:hypothetical protein [Methylobacter sp.]